MRVRFSERCRRSYESVPLAVQRSQACLGARERLQFWHMSHTITVRLPKELAAWLEQVAAKTGVPQGKIVRDQLERAKAGSPRPSFMRLAGSVRGPRALSSRKAFARP